MATFIDADHGATIELGTPIQDHGREPGDDVGGTRISKAKNYDLRGGPFRESRDLAEIKIERQEDPVFRDRLGKNFGIGQSLQGLLAQVNGVVSCGPKPADDLEAHSHVGQKAQALRGVNLFPR
jgi:hypothetical protein